MKSANNGANSQNPSQPITYGQRLRELSHFVQSKIMGLYKGLQEGDSQSRARLACLRRSAEGDGRLWMLIGDDLFDGSLGGRGWNSEILGQPEPRNAYFSAALAALRFYALHQQSQGANVNTTDPHTSFGLACSLIGSTAPVHDTTSQEKVDDHDAEPQSGVRRRLYAMERATDFRSLLTEMRGLVSMLRKSGGQAIPLNYGVLAQDLYRLQQPSQREDVFRRWAHDFYSPHREVEVKSLRKP